MCNTNDNTNTDNNSLIFEVRIRKVGIIPSKVKELRTATRWQVFLLNVKLDSFAKFIYFIILLKYICTLPKTEKPEKK